MVYKLWFVLVLFFPAMVFAQNLETSIPEPMLANLQLGGLDSSVYGFVGHSQYANFISPSNVGVFLLDYGSSQFRLGLTWGHVLTPRQRLKFSIEHFSQRNTFDFAAYPDKQFIGQNQFGGQYEYAVVAQRLEAIIFRGYYFQANNSNLGDVPIATGEINHRLLVGGTGGGFSIGPRWRLWPGAQIAMGLGYDTVQFNTENEPEKNSAGLGQAASLTQNLGKNSRLELVLTNHKPYQQYAANINYALSRSLALQINLSHLHSHILPATNENLIGLSLLYQWGGEEKKMSTTQRCFQGDRSCDLMDWSTHSAAYLPGVFVQRDQKISE